MEAAPVGPKRPRGTQSPGAPVEVELTIDTIRELERDLTHMQRVDMMAELAASLAHEITEPIAAVELGAEACLRWIDRDPPAVEEVRQVLLRIVKDAKRAASIVERHRSLYGEGRHT
jgi:signal transduction histidine kinase